MSYRILELHAENIKRISVVNITPTGDLVEISGGNDQGKTSVLDAIEMALAGADAVPAVPIRRGSRNARVAVTLGDGGKAELIVERKFTAGGNRAGYLSITTPDGMQPLKAQTMLDGLLGALSMDPLEFSRMEPVKQFAVLRKLAPIAVDIDALDRRRAVLYESRTDANRNAKRHQSAADTIGFPADLPETAPDVQSILDELAGVDAINADIRLRLRLLDEARAMSARCAKRVDELKLLYDTALKDRASADASLKALEDTTIEPLIEPKAVQARLADAQAIARYCGLRERKREFEAAAKAEVDDSDKITAAIDGIDKLKAEAIGAAKMPVDGLSFGNNEVLYNGLPLSQASDAGRLLVSTRMAAALNPKLRVIRIRDGSLLDSTSMAVLKTFAETSNLQIWIERVGAGTGVVIEDGHVKGQEELAEAHAANEIAMEKAMQDEALPAFVDGEGQKAIQYRDGMAQAIGTAQTLEVLDAYRTQAKRRLKDFSSLWRTLNGAIMVREMALKKK